MSILNAVFTGELEGRKKGGISMKKLISMLLTIMLVSSFLAILVTPAYGNNLILPNNGVVSVEFLYSDADFINDVSVVSPVSRLLFNTQTTRRGATVFLGSFATGADFEFQLLANTGSGQYTWSSDPTKNSDAKDHVKTTKVA